MNPAIRNSVITASLALGAAVCFAQPPAVPQAAKGYTLGVFAKSVRGKYTAPDSIAYDRKHVYIGYGDGNAPDGSDGKNTQIVQYSREGVVEHIYKVHGHNDGLRIDPMTHLLWALQNEDANSNAVAIDTVNQTQTQYYFEAPPAAGGGYDDGVFRGETAFLSASNPAHNPNTEPAIVQARLENGKIVVKPILYGNAEATDVVTGKKVTLNLQDPDSLTYDPSGDLFMTSQGDGELIVVRKPGKKNQSVLQIPLTSPYGTPMVDDTIFVPDSDGFILIADKDANTVYTLRKAAYVPGSAYSAAQATAPDGTTYSFLGKLDTEYGTVTPIVTGMGNPGGLAYVKTGEEDSAKEELIDFCQNLLGAN